MKFLKKYINAFSHFLYKSHLYIEGKLKEKVVQKPYLLKYQPSKSNIKIIHVNGNFIVGGSSQLIIDIIERTSDKYDHQIIVPDYPDPLPYQPVSIKKFSIVEMHNLYQYLEAEMPSLVHIHYWVRKKNKYEPYALWYQSVFEMCEDLNLKVIQNINVPTLPFVSSAIAHNVFVSKYVLDHFNINNTKASVIYPGSDFGHFTNEDIKDLPDNNIGMVYRLDQDKLNADAIEVFIRIVKRKPLVQCYIVGNGFFFEYYKTRVEEERLTNNFVFTGVVSYDMLPEYYKKISVFVAPVHDESFGQVTPFAMNIGITVAGYDTGALSEILGSKETLVEYGNIEALVQMIIELLDNPEKRKKLGENNKKRTADNFSVENMILEYQRLYETYLTIDIY